MAGAEDHTTELPQPKEGQMDLTVVPRPPHVQAPSGAELTLLPHRRTGDAGVYDEALIPLGQSLQDQQLVSWNWGDPPDQRLWQGRRSAHDLAVEIIVGVASNAAWALLVRTLSQMARPSLVSVTLGSRTTAEAEERWMHIEGDPKHVAAVLEKVNPWNEPPRS